ncbi:MAG: [protein-PII] uridylyltransferase [Nocardiaceae bacterium]|nr:[protein-PII] uridylyltransferase [Nocardiaceae bacterium]
MPSDPKGSRRGGPAPAGKAGAGPSPSAGPNSGARKAAAGSSPSSAPNVSKSAGDLSRALGQLLENSRGRHRRLDAKALRAALLDLYEFWLTSKGHEAGILAGSGFALVAVGGLARREMLPYSDLDLVLLHDQKDQTKVSEVADSLWYPLWDAHIKLDHSVRTVPQALSVASTDLTAMLGLLEARHIVGDEDLSGALIDGVRKDWRANVRNRFDEVVEQTRSRWQRSGDVAHRAEPDLKNGRGGMRDVQLLEALSLAQLTDGMPSMSGDWPSGGPREAERHLLDVRTELHVVARRARDQLRAQDADEIGAALGIGDRFDLARMISDSARTITYAVDVGLRTAQNALPRKGISRLRRAPVRRPLDEGVVEHAGEVVLARDARPERDPGLILRVAAASAQTGLPMSAGTLSRLAESAPELRTPWPKEAVNDFLVMLGAGTNTIDVIEALDRTGLWGRLLLELGAVRDLPPRDSIHTWTVDRHLVEATVYAAGFATRVSRPDLLVLGALLHDIGKGRAGDHSTVGAELARQIGKRLGLWPDDIDLLARMVRFHLLLPSTAARRDLADPATAEDVVAQLDGDAVLLDLLHALAEADSLATGPGVWGDWKSTLIGELVRRCRAVLAGENLPAPDPIPPELLERAGGGGLHVDMRPMTEHTHMVTIIAPDRPGLLSDAAGVLALNSLRVLGASVGGSQGSAINTFAVSPRFGAPPDPQLLRLELMRAISGSLDVDALLAKRAAEWEATKPVVVKPTGLPSNHPHPKPRVLWFPDAHSGLKIMELRAEDQLGLLSKVAGALEKCGADVRWAKVSTMGSLVVDTFCIEVGAVPMKDIEAAVLAVVENAKSAS